MDERKVLEIKKDISISKNKYKITTCLLCNNRNVRFAYSHSVPRFVLKNIANDGIVKHAISLQQTESINLFDSEKGVSNTGVFHSICEECERKFFTKYESEESLAQRPSGEMMLEIAIKNTLFELSKIYQNKGLYDFLNSSAYTVNTIKSFVNDDSLEVREQLIRLKKAFKKKKNVEFDLFFWTTLKYITPIAFQGNVVLIGDLKGFIVNNVFDYDKRHPMHPINLCVFPLRRSTVIMAFNDKSYQNNYRFINQFKKKSFEDQLCIVNYIILSMTEDYYLSPNVDKNVLENNNLKDVCSGTHLVSENVNGKLSKEDCKKLQELLKDMRLIPNLLSKEYALK